MLLLENTYKQQSALAGYCRSGIYTPIQGVNTRNISHYRRLVFNVVLDSLESAYPLTHNLLLPEEWENLALEFFTNHPCQSPQVWYMPKEFYEYIKNVNHPLIHKYLHLLELLLFEWLEIEVYMMEDERVEEYHSIGEYLVINPELRIIELSYPIHLKNAKYITISDKGKYYVSLHRHPETGKVLFTNLSLPHALLLHYLYEGASDYTGMLEIFTRFANSSEANDALKVFLAACIESKLILGFSNTNINTNTK